MGEVFRARDTTLGREVAIKFLPPDLANDPERLARFDREARVLASLNHPNIATVYGFERGDPATPGSHALIMELVDGETLEERIARGRGHAAQSPVPIADVLQIARQIAAGLEAAHAKGIVHRDLKPANIKVRPDGTVKLLDFGLAKITAGDAAATAMDAASTATMDGTRYGVILGTAPYMCPEQARGEAVDVRADIWAFGCVLYEMLTGRPPFARPNVAETLAAILGQEPDWTALPGGTPEALRGLIRRCVEKDVRLRLADIREARSAIDEMISVGLSGAAPQGSRRATDRAPRRALAASRLTAPSARLATGVLLLLGLAAIAWTIHDRATGSGASTIAVLPFVNTSADPEQSYLAEGLSNAVVLELENQAGIRVVSGASTMRYMSSAGPSMAGGMSVMNSMPSSGSGGGMGPQKSFKQIAGELRAALVLHGTVTRDADRVQAAVALVRIQPVETVWERTFSRPRRELFALQRDIVRAVSESVGEGDALRGDGAAAKHDYDPAAHDAYLKGVYYQAHWKLPQAVEAFTRATDIDPAHAAAQSGLSRAYYFLAFFGDLSPSVALAGMRRAATRAIKDDPSMAEAYGQLALVKMLQDWDWKGAEENFRRALDLSPENANLRHDYAHFLLGQGRRRESAEQAARAVALDPVNPMLISCLGWHKLFDGRFDEAVKLANEARDLMPDHWAEIVLGWALLGQGDQEGAVAHMREARRLKESGFTLSALAHALAITGRRTEAQQVLQHLLGRAEHEYVSAYDVATVYAGLSDADAVFRWLRRAADERSMFIAHVGWDLRLDSVRRDPRLADLIAREMRLPAPQFARLTPAERRGM
jgi:TolB-like protein/Flp pilus assembly protein TadD